jgi:hypothetical protein
MNSVMATFWVLYVTVTPIGTDYKYTQEFGSREKCNAVVEQIRSSNGMDWTRSTVDCTDIQPPAGVFEYIVPRQQGQELS